MLDILSLLPHKMTFVSLYLTWYMQLLITFLHWHRESMGPKSLGGRSGCHIL